jgi:hypothetical protein
VGVCPGRRKPATTKSHCIAGSGLEHEAVSEWLRESLETFYFLPFRRSTRRALHGNPEDLGAIGRGLAFHIFWSSILMLTAPYYPFPSPGRAASRQLTSTLGDCASPQIIERRFAAARCADPMIKGHGLPGSYPLKRLITSSFSDVLRNSVAIDNILGG